MNTQQNNFLYNYYKTFPYEHLVVLVIMFRSLIASILQLFRLKKNCLDSHKYLQLVHYKNQE